MALRLAFVLFAIPRFGIRGYLWGMLASELLLAFMCFVCVKRLVDFKWDTLQMIVKPVFILFLSIGICLAFSRLEMIALFPPFVQTFLKAGFLGACYVGLLLVVHR
jgi:stage V sporulation protein B